MGKKAMKVVGSRASVFKGKRTKTVGGLKKSSLKRNKRGKIVSLRKSNRAKNSKGGKVIMKWGKATKAARKALKIKGFCPVGGKTAQGKALLKKVREILG